MTAEDPTRYNEHPLKIRSSTSFRDFYPPGLLITINSDEDSQNPYASISKFWVAYPIYRVTGYIRVEDINGKKGTSAFWLAREMRALP